MHVCVCVCVWGGGGGGVIHPFLFSTDCMPRVMWPCGPWPLQTHAGARKIVISIHHHQEFFTIEYFIYVDMYVHNYYCFFFT